MRAMQLSLAGLVMVMVIALSAMADSRELATPVDDLIEVELASVGINPMTGSPVVLLRETLSGDVVPIFIGVPEARAILLAMHDTRMPRPMTHDLMRDLLTTMGARLERVLVDDLANGTYYGMLELRITGNDEPVRVDTRPSDALALAVRTGASIHVAPKILIAGRNLDYEALPDDQVVTALGITVVAVTSRLRDTLDLPDLPGLLVNRSAGAAAAAGLNPGSLILEINGQIPGSPMQLLDLVRDTPSGEQVEIRFWQDGERGTLLLSPEATGTPERSEDDGREVTV